MEWPLSAFEIMALWEMSFSLICMRIFLSLFSRLVLCCSCLSFSLYSFSKLYGILYLIWSCSGVAECSFRVQGQGRDPS